MNPEKRAAVKSNLLKPYPQTRHKCLMPASHWANWWLLSVCPKCLIMLDTRLSGRKSMEYLESYESQVTVHKLSLYTSLSHLHPLVA